MTLHVTVHLHDVPEDRAQDYAQWFDGPHREALQRLRGFKAADRFKVSEAQVMPDIPQPWTYMSVYEVDVDTPEIDLPALAPLIAEARDAGMIDDSRETERIHTYRMYSDWVSSPNHQPDKPLSHVSIILANFVPGMEPEYHKWYDEVHIPEVSNTPGNVAMRRGRLSPIQLEPRRYCPGSDLVMCAMQTDDLFFTVRDFSARARGVSPSGIAWSPRSKSGSIARTVHYFEKISGTEHWPGGTAYAGDWAPYENATWDRS